VTAVDKDLAKNALWVRQQVLKMISRASKGHIGGSLSAADILVFLYQGGVFRLSPEFRSRPDRDVLIYSKGHSCEALYAVLAQTGYFDAAILSTYGSDGSSLGGHPDRKLPGVEMSAGSLGQGLGVAAGMAIANKLRGCQSLTLAVLGDGECYEGSVWEAAMFAAHHGLCSLIAIVDRNGQITLDRTEDCNRLEPFAEKWLSCGWEVRECDGHSFPALRSALGDARSRVSDRPLVVVARTIKGRGVSFMEGEVGWHHAVPRGEQLKEAMKDLGLVDVD